jgi:hypothetical protein
MQHGGMTSVSIGRERFDRSHARWERRVPPSATRADQWTLGSALRSGDGWSVRRQTRFSSKSAHVPISRSSRLVLASDSYANLHVVVPGPRIARPRNVAKRLAISRRRRTKRNRLGKVYPCARARERELIFASARVRRRIFVPNERDKVLLFPDRSPFLLGYYLSRNEKLRPSPPRPAPPRPLSRARPEHPPVSSRSTT